MNPKILLHNSSLRVDGGFNQDLYDRKCDQDKVLEKFKKNQELNEEDANHLKNEYGIMDAYYRFHSLEESEDVIGEEDRKLLRHHPDYPTSIGCHDCVYDNSECVCSPYQCLHRDSGTWCTPLYCETRIRGKLTGISPCLFYRRGDFVCFSCIVGGGDDETLAFCFYVTKTGKKKIISPCFCLHESENSYTTTVVPNGLERNYRKKAMQENIAVRKITTKSFYIYGIIPVYSEIIEQGPIVQVMSNEEFINQVDGQPPQEM